MLIAVCDDEKAVREKIRDLIKAQNTDAHIVLFATGEEVLASPDSFDMIFLDIQMEGINGIDTARELRKREEEAVLIFVTGAKEYVFEAFDVTAFHYLLKPIAEKKFAEVFANAWTEAQKKKEGLQLVFKAGSRHVRVSRDDILYIESRARKAEIHTVKEVLEIYADMKTLEEKLDDGFCCCHKGFLVNMAYIAEYDRERIILTNGENLYLSRRKSSEFVKKYLQYLRKGGKLLG